MKVTVCGSARFGAELLEAERELSLRGHTVYSLAATGREIDGREKAILDLVYLSKIEESDWAVVAGDGYVGESVAREVIWACIRGKLVLTLWPFERGDGINWYDVDMALRTGNDWSVSLLRRCEGVLLEGGHSIRG